jgi:hypothetical protein
MMAGDGGCARITCGWRGGERMAADDVQTDVARPGASRRSFGGRRAVCGLLVLLAVGWLWWHSYRAFDVLAVFGPQGKVGGVASMRGELMVAFTDVSMGAERAWTAVTDSTSIEDGERIRVLLTDTPRVTRRWGFLAARHGPDAFGLKAQSASVVAAPHWVLLPIGLWPLLGWVVRRGRWLRWRRKGWCLACGYDLRGIEGRCPECGEERVILNSK